MFCGAEKFSKRVVTGVLLRRALWFFLCHEGHGVFRMVQWVHQSAYSKQSVALELEHHYDRYVEALGQIIFSSIDTIGDFFEAYRFLYFSAEIIIILNRTQLLCIAVSVSVMYHKNSYW